uniref:Si:ch73-126o18.1 n=1 Tax=Oncorhynchus kisutch TaxID=8019 RepID=A0A8C7DP58_ONCKI
YLQGLGSILFQFLSNQTILMTLPGIRLSFIDGNRNSNYNYGGSCSSTAFNTNPWWRVDLLDVYRVTAVNITNRGDCCPERLDGAEIHIGNSLKNNGINNPRCVVISNIPAGETNTFQCNEMEGQYVVVVIPGQNKILTLCEVEVFATVKPPGTSLPVHVFILSVMVCRIITSMTRIYFLSNTFSGDDNCFPMHVFLY